MGSDPIPENELFSIKIHCTIKKGLHIMMNVCLGNSDKQNMDWNPGRYPFRSQGVFLELP